MKPGVAWNDIRSYQVRHGYQPEDSELLSTTKVIGGSGTWTPDLLGGRRWIHLATSCCFTPPSKKMWAVAVSKLLPTVRALTVNTTITYQSVLFFCIDSLLHVDSQRDNGTVQYLDVISFPALHSPHSWMKLDVSSPSVVVTMPQPLKSPVRNHYNIQDAFVVSVHILRSHFKLREFWSTFCERMVTNLWKRIVWSQQTVDASDKFTNRWNKERLETKRWQNLNTSQF